MAGVYNIFIKMKNLENYGVQVLNAKGASDTESGWWNVTISGGSFNRTNLYGDNTNSSLWV